jgi:D-tagatose-1,6-bisphosphate aldolase subunit GatZ/KbaZ
MTAPAQLLTEVATRNREGAATGIYAVCSANRLVLEACFEQALADGGPLLIEATCNQVNQEGGYTGMTPERFREEVLAIGSGVGFPADRLILGADHLGPSPWQALPAAEAMERAKVMVAAYTAAGCAKIHLDASMSCADDPSPLPAEVIAGRAAELCRVAEATARERSLPGPVYVVGTEVPTPGGAKEALDHLAPTPAHEVDETLTMHRERFAALDLGAAWERVLAVVVQPGVEFGHRSVVDYVPEAATALSRAILVHDRLVFEAHSTDYQTRAALRALVTGHFAILKVGPGLTFAAREALFALDAIEREWLPAERRAGVRDTLEQAMLADPRYWQAYYRGSAEEQRLARAYSLSDRCRYYWGVAELARAVGRLLTNLAQSPPPLPLVSQYLPAQHAALRQGRLDASPRSWVRHKIREVAGDYAWACGLGPGLPEA